MGLFRKSAKKRAEERRLAEVTALLLKIENEETFWDNLLPWELQLLSKLQEQGITKASDLNNKRQRNLVKSGLGIGQMQTTQSFSEYVLQGQEEVTHRVMILDNQMGDEIVANKRVAEARVLLSNMENIEVHKQDLAEFQEKLRQIARLKSGNLTEVEYNQLLAQVQTSELHAELRNTSDLNKLEERVTALIQETMPKVFPTPLNMRLLEAMREHGITKADDLDKIQNCLWISRGMPGTFVEKEIGLRPTETFTIMELGASRDEITANQNKRHIDYLTQRFSGALTRMAGAGDKAHIDVETAAYLSLLGISRPEDLAKEDVKKWMLTQKTGMKGYNGKGEVVPPVDEHGFPAVERSADMTAMLDFYAKNHRIATIEELRQYQAEAVMRKVMAGKPLTQSEDVLYAALTRYGVADVTDLKKPDVVTGIREGLPKAFSVVSHSGFGAVSKDDMHAWLAEKYDEVKRSEAYVGVPPKQANSILPEARGMAIDAYKFAAQMESAYATFSTGGQLTLKQEELLACAIMSGYPDYKSFMKNVVSNPLKSELATNQALFDKIDLAYDQSGQPFENTEMDEQGFIKNREYPRGAKEFILKLREAEKAPKGQRVLPEYVSGMNRVDRMKLLAKEMSEAKKPQDQIPPPENLKKKDLEILRLEEARQVLDKASINGGSMTAYERQFLAALQDNGITKIDDLNQKRKVQRIKAGLGLPDIGNKSLRYYFNVEKKVYDPILTNNEAAYTRFMQATMILEKFNDHDHLMEQLETSKKYYHASLMLEKPNLSPEEKARYEADLVGSEKIVGNKTGAKRTKKLMDDLMLTMQLAMPTPTETLLYETMVAHGITKASDLDDPVKDMFVRRGMPGSFIGKQVKLRPDQTYDDLAYGLSQQEIAANKLKANREQLVDNFKDAFENVGKEVCKPFDVLRVAALRAQGIESAEQLASNTEFLDKKAVGVYNEVFPLFELESFTARNPGPDGYPNIAGMDENAQTIIAMFRRDRKWPTNEEIRLEQASQVVDKVMAGEDLKEWEQTLYAGLVKQGVKTKEDLANPDIKTAVQQGLPAQFAEPGKIGFGKLTYNSMSKEAAEEVISFQRKNTTKEGPAVNRADIMRKFAQAMERVNVYEQRYERPRANQRQAVNVAAISRQRDNQH